MVSLGSKMPNFSLKGVGDCIYNADDFSNKKVLVVIFMCNHCPYVQAMWDDLVSIAKEMESVQFVGINSNANLDYPEDSFEKMAAYAKERDMDFPYLFDEDQSVAKKFGAVCTPDIFVYGPDRKLEYRGAFEGVREAAEAILKGKKPKAQQKYSQGCSIKWVS